jgi:hypothetical protein
MVTIAWNPLGFYLVNALPKGNAFNAESYRVNILTELRSLRPQVDGRRVVIHAGNARSRPLENTELFTKKIGSAWPYTHYIHLISHHPTSFSSNISNIACRESLFHHVTNYLRQLMKSSGPSRDQPWRTCFGTGWRDSNGFLRSMVTTVYKLNTG